MAPRRRPKPKRKRSGRSAPPKPMCFVAMPFGRKAAYDRSACTVDFDKVYKFIEKAVRGAGMECIRADFEPGGGFIHRPMFERLLVAEYVVADLTMSNPNVAYEVGVRHGASDKSTVLLCAREFVGQLPFDLKPLRVLTYRLGKSGALSQAEGAKLRRALERRLRQALNDELPSDNPILQLTGIAAPRDIGHEKTDVFLRRMQYVSVIGKEVKDALLKPPGAAARSLRLIEKRILASRFVVPQLHTELMALFLGYRESEAYTDMDRLFRKLPRELRQTPVALEQHALALNRLAEKAAKGRRFSKARQLRERALSRLDELEPASWTSETYGIAGRIYKGQVAAGQLAGDEPASEAALDLAIDTYEKGFRLDPRDYYPGVNAVTLRLLRGSAADRKALDALLPALRFSIDRAAKPKDQSERYWQEATRLELACDMGDWDGARKACRRLLAVRAADWMRKTTISNLKMLKQSPLCPEDGTQHLDALIRQLKP